MQNFHSLSRRHLVRLGLGSLLGSGLLAGSGCRTSSTEKSLDVWSMWSGQEEKNFQQVLNRYRETTTHVPLHNLGAVSDDTKTIRALVAGVPPDLCTLSDPSYLGPLARNRAIRPLDDLFRQSGLREEDFIPASLNLCRYQGQLYGIPYLIDDMALLWDKQAFTEANLDPENPPKTLEELAEAAIKLTKRDATGKITRLGLRPLGVNEDLLLMHLFEGQLIDPQTGRITADHPGNVAAISWYKNLVDKLGGIEVVSAFASGFGRDQGVSNPFYVGKVAMMFNGEWNPCWVSRYAPQLKYNVAPVPAPADHPNRLNSTWLGGNVFVIPAESRFQQEAWEFLVWTQTLEAQELFAYAMNNVPNQRAALQSPKLRSGPPFRKQYSKFLDLANSPNAGYFPALPVTQFYNNQLSTAIDRIMYGERPVEQALAEVRVRVQKELDRS